MLWAAECIQIDKYRIAFYLSRIFDTKVVRICEHGHDFLTDVICFVRQIDAVAERFAHLGFAIDTWQTETCLIVRKYDLRICQSLAVYAVEFVNDFLTLLDHWHLVFANRNSSCTECSNISCLTDRIAEETNRNAGFKVTLLDLSFYRRVTLYTGYSHQVHIIKTKLCKLRNHGLDKNSSLLRINTACQIIQCNLKNILANFLRMLSVVCQSLCVGDHDINLIELS